MLSPVLGAPDIVVPIGEYEYDSLVSGRKKSLPVAKYLDSFSGDASLSSDPISNRTYNAIFSKGFHAKDMPKQFLIRIVAISSMLLVQGHP